MATYVLDTDMVSLLQANHSAVLTRIKASSPLDVFSTAITIDEQLSGWYTYLRRATKPIQIEKAYSHLVNAVIQLARLPMLSFTVAAIARFEQLRKQKLNVGKNDLRIAAIALEAGAIVVTRNVRDFGRVSGLIVEDWSVPSTPSPPAP
jgi:tRNA(fMet)-specific endonuclease VapC